MVAEPSRVRRGDCRQLLSFGASARLQKVTKCLASGLGHAPFVFVDVVRSHELFVSALVNLEDNLTPVVCRRNSESVPALQDTGCATLVELKGQ